MKEELREIIELKIQILSERKTKDGSLYILAPWIMTGKKNRNGRLYSQPLIRREVTKFQDRVKQGSAIGSADHPAGAFTTLDNASHIITKLTVDKDGKGWMEAKILPTSKGKNVIEIINGGGQLGISARGAGTVSPSGIVGDDYKLLGIDFCTNPSEPTAVFNKSNIFESAEFEENLDTQRQKDLEESISNLEKESFLGACESGWKGTEEEWHEMYGGGLREMVGLPVSGRETPVQKLTEEQISARTHSYYKEAVQAGFIGTFADWKEKFPQIVEQAREKKVALSEKKEGIKEPFKSKSTWAEIQLSGFRGTMQEFEEKFPNITILKPEVQKPIVEKTLKESAALIFTGLMKDNPKSGLLLEDIIALLEKKEIAEADKRLRKRAIYIVNASIAGSGSAPSQELLSRMVEDEIEHLKKLRQERREKNWQAFQKILSD
jgi:hypothetical protein